MINCQTQLEEYRRSRYYASSKRGLDKLKEVLLSGVSKEIADTIIELSKNAKNTVELMALCGFFHEHGCSELATAFWKLVKDPYTKKYAEIFSSLFTTAQDGWYRAVCSWYVTVTTSAEIEAIVKVFSPDKTSILPPYGMVKPRRLRQD